MTTERILTLIVVVCSLVLGYEHFTLRSVYERLEKRIMATEPSRTLHQNEECLIGSQLPHVTLPDAASLTGSPLVSSDYRLLFIFSASDCAPCLLEALQLLARFHSSKETASSVVAVGHADLPIELLKIKKLSGAQFPFLFDEQRAVETGVGRGRQPVLLLVDARGRILSACFATQERLERFTSFLENMVVSSLYGS